MTKPGNFVIAGGVFILIIFVGTWLISSGAEEDPSWVDADTLAAYNNTFNSYVEYNQKVAALESQTRGASGASEESLWGDAFSFINNLFSAGWNTIKLIGKNFGFIYDIFTGVSSVFGIPTWLTSIVVSLLIAMLAFGLLSLVFGRETLK